MTHSVVPERSLKMPKPPPTRGADTDEDAGAARVVSDDGADDPLGKLYEQHRVTLAGVLVVAGFVACVGIGVLIYGLSGQPYSLYALLIGTGVLLCAVALVGVNAFNVGRHLELRKRGIRYTESGVITELLWKEIVDIDVKRTDDTNLGAVNVRKRSKNALAPSGPLTKTEWDVSIRADDGRTIRLPPMFLRTVRDPKKLISQLRLRAGI
jgi:hypothetical protein